LYHAAIVFLLDFPIGNASGGEQRVWYYTECRLLMKATLNAGHVDLTILTERERSAQSSASLADRGKEIRRAFESP
jgi:hypothetical protein